MDATLIEHYPALAAHSKTVMHGFVRRVPDIDVQTDRAAALERLEAAHRQARRMLAIERRPFVTAQQVHGAEVAVISAKSILPDGPIRGVDALVTDQHHCLGIYVADCAVVFFVDPVRHVIGLAHSGRRGTEQGIAAATVAAMAQAFGSNPGDVLAQIAPCIRLPNYEVDFPAEIVRQLRAAGLTKIEDCGVCTFSSPDRYYSYRRELGKTGRMVGLLALRS